MLRRARELGPPLLVPLAWTFVTAAHVDAVTNGTIAIAHVVMATMLAVFAATGRPDMREGVLAVWWWVIAVGFVATACGAIGFWTSGASEPLWAIALGGWMLLPAAGFVYTGRRVEAGRWIYAGATLGCVLGALLYVWGTLASIEWAPIGGLVLVGVGQTAGILDAALRY